jgi:hypothetical protein
MSDTTEAVQKMIDDGYIAEDSRIAASVVLSALSVGPSDRRVAKDIGLTRSAVYLYAERLRKAGVWTRAGKIAVECIGGDDPEGASAEFLMLVCVAMGFIVRAKKELRR